MQVFHRHGIPLDASLFQKDKEIRLEVVQPIKLPQPQVLGELWIHNTIMMAERRSQALKFRKVEKFEPMRHERPQPQTGEVEWKVFDGVRYIASFYKNQSLNAKIP